MVASQVSLISGLLVLGFASGAIPTLNHDQSKDNSVTEAPWIPATQPRDFSYNIQDGIQGASQIRQETWKNGTMNGLYAFPLGDGLWQMVTYIADEKGYRIVSSKQVTEAEMLQGAAHADSDTANVDINRDGDKTAYKVKADEIFKAAKKNHTEDARQHRRGLGLYEAHQNASQAALDSRGAGPAQLNASEVAAESRGAVGPMPAKLNASAAMDSGDWPAGPMARSAGPMPKNASVAMDSGDWPAGPMTRSAGPMPKNASAAMDSGDWPAGPMARSTDVVAQDSPVDLDASTAGRGTEDDVSDEESDEQFNSNDQVTA